MQAKTFEHGRPFNLESGTIIPGFRLAYTTAGQLNEAKDNVVWIFHALTGNSDPLDWWSGLVGTGKIIDPARHFIVCVNMPGSCYGSTGPLDYNPRTGEPWYHEFPFFTPRDMARAYHYLRLHLGIERIWLGMGGSMGGQQLLEWATEEPHLFEKIIPMATNAFHSAWGKAFNASQRMCIEADPTWKERHPQAGMEGMKVARSIALLSYRHYRTYAATQQDDPERLEHYRAESYQRYQGDKLAARFNAFSYHALTKGMDAHHLGRSRGSIHEALASIRAKTLVIGINTDVLYPPEEQEYIARQIPGGQFALLHSHYGHDAFLVEYEKLEEMIRPFLTD
ncbi:MAG: homoserine O-acetyltransferase family protein [Chitinophagaceae bacterium]|jgi:homoserine O-acetyltransferase